MSEKSVRVCGYYIFGEKQGVQSNVPMSFFQFVTNKQFKDRWDNVLNKGEIARNIQTPTWYTKAVHQPFWVGRFVEVFCQEKIDLLKFDDGTDGEFKIPENYGKKESWEFILAPNKGLVVLELKGRGIERKFEEYFNRLLTQFRQLSGGSPGECPDFIKLEAITTTEEPKKFLQRNKISTFEARIDAGTIDQDSGLTLPILRGLGEERKHLKIKIEISHVGRGVELPTIVVSQLSDLVENLKGHGITQASAKQLVGGRREQRPTQLFDPLYIQAITIGEGDDREKQMAEFMDNLIENAYEVDT